MKKTTSLDLKTIILNLKKIQVKLQRYNVIIFIVILAGLYGYLIVQVSGSATKEPTQAQVMEELGTVKRLKIDQSSIDKIEQLEDQNVVVQSLFEEARDNPFSE